ncbi:MAG: hypothetical protein DWQ34_06760 [Planctomycetota bacterium]|nr:MAG: hypothetical protein DWQ34_06760 [Planctomycetota bacterium]REK25068.1 MAG: hypothetical protein DWQ41_12910 [Planctomycetota bacterium]REK28133.1 MAG: hypothetical protein DWQ45_25235 [Planctomycetota bacterium]
MAFDFYIGIDYSGRKMPTSRTPALQVYAAFGDEEPRCIESPASTKKSFKNWCRKEIAEWLIEQAAKDSTFIVGIDHAFSFPITYFERYNLKTWDDFLDDFCEHWPTDQDHTCVDFIRNAEDCPPDRAGLRNEFRLTEKWTSSAKSVFHFDVQGQVAKSTHAGIPWLRGMREAVGDRLHFWPFDGWKVTPGQSVVVESYPSIFRNRYEKADRSPDQQDAYATARWLAETDVRGVLERYSDPPLVDAERTQAEIEGWIIGVC